MKIVFSRKGFDSSAGGGPSPIVDGRPVSLPIPTDGPSRTTWGDLGLGEHVAQASRGRWCGADLCHHDPMFLESGTCLFGQCGAAQTHLVNEGVGAGDVFVFFGLFREGSAAPHHRIFGYLAVEEVVSVASASAERLAELAAHGHPHALGLRKPNDTIYVGRGRAARCAPELLRLTAPGASPSTWRTPDWLRPGELSYHRSSERWSDGLLRAASRGQEFVADVGERRAPREWLERVIAAIEAPD